MRRHDTDITSLVFGLIFIGIAALWALVEGDVLALPTLTVLGPTVLVVAGLVGLIATVRSARRGEEPAASAAPLDKPTADSMGSPFDR